MMVNKRNIKDKTYAKVINQYCVRDDDKCPPFLTWHGITECCEEIVSRHQYGCDEECPCCGKWLDWFSEE